MIRGYYFITDSSLSKKGNISDVKNAVAAGVTVVQYRNKQESSADMLKEAFELKKICQNTQFIINDKIDIALAVDADGLHIGEQDVSYHQAREILGKDKIIGVTVRSVEEARKAQESGADYLGVGSIFATTTKKIAVDPVGPSLIKNIKDVCLLPLVAIGGINLDNAKAVVDAGADALSAISSVVTKDNVEKEILKFQALFN